MPLARFLNTITTIVLSVSVVLIVMTLYIGSVADRESSGYDSCIKTYGSCDVCASVPNNTSFADNFVGKGWYIVYEESKACAITATVFSAAGGTTIIVLVATLSESDPHARVGCAITLAIIALILTAWTFSVAWRMKNACLSGADESWHFMTGTVGMFGIAWGCILIVVSGEGGGAASVAEKGSFGGGNINRRTREMYRQVIPSVHE